MVIFDKEDRDVSIEKEFELAFKKEKNNKKNKISFFYDDESAEDRRSKKP